MAATYDHARGLLSASSDVPATLADQAFAELESLIVTLELPPGAEITEKQICDRIGMGRTPVREALLRLRYFGLVEVSGGRGLVVSPLYYEEMLEVLEVGGMLARLFLPRAAAQRTMPEARRFQSLADAFEQVAETSDLPGYLRLHLALQELIGVTARQPVAWRLCRPLTSMTRRLAVVRERAMGDTLKVFGSRHAGLARALADGDSSEATMRLDTLLAIWVDVIESLMAEPAARDLFAALKTIR